MAAITTSWRSTILRPSTSRASIFTGWPDARRAADATSACLGNPPVSALPVAAQGILLRLPVPHRPSELLQLRGAGDHTRRRFAGAATDAAATRVLLGCPPIARPI